MGKYKNAKPVMGEAKPVMGGDMGACAVEALQQEGQRVDIDGAKPQQVHAAWNAGAAQDQSITAIVKDGGVRVIVKGNQGGAEVRAKIEPGDLDQVVSYQVQDKAGISEGVVSDGASLPWLKKGVKPQKDVARFDGFPWLQSDDKTPEDRAKQLATTKEVAATTVGRIKECMERKKGVMKGPGE